MYESFFGFNERPFTAVPRVDRYFPSAAMEWARNTLIRCVERSEGCGLMVGPTGTGKTLLCQVLAEQFQDRLDVVLLSSVRLTSRKELLQAISFELGLPYKRLHEGELRLGLIDRISVSDECPHGMLLIVDEAHALSPRLLEELRLLTNLVRGGLPRVRLVLAGATVLDERFASPRLASFNQRLVARCFLEPFSAEETYEYVRAQTAAAGVDPDLAWSAEALRAVHHATDGCPRLINQVCDLALLMAAQLEKDRVDEQVVNEAWAELQQLPMPWNADKFAQTAVADATNGQQSPGAVIEFRSLEDESEGTVWSDETHHEEATGIETVATDTERESQIDHGNDDPVQPEHGPDVHLDRIQAHLEEVEQPFVEDDHDPVAPPAVVQERRDPPETIQQQPPIQQPLPSSFDEDHSVIDVPAKSETVVFDSFAGLEGETVVQLSPNVRPVVADDSCDPHDPESCQQAAEDSGREKGGWLAGLARLMQHEADEEIPDAEAPEESGTQPAENHGAASLGQASAPLAATELHYVDMQYVDEDVKVIEGGPYDPVAPMPSIVVEYADEGQPGIHITPHDSCQAEASSGGTKRSDEAVAESATADLTGGAGTDGDSPAVRHEHTPASGPPAQTPPIATPAQELDVTNLPLQMTEHPSIPVRQREFRQLFAKLRRREMLKESEQQN